MNDFDKYLANKNKNNEKNNAPKSVDLGKVMLKDSETDTIKGKHVNIKLRKAFVALATAGAVLGLAATGYGAASLVAMAALPQYTISALGTALGHGLLTYAGYKVTRKSLPTAMKNSSNVKIRNIYWTAKYTVDDLKDGLGMEGKSRK